MHYSMWCYDMTAVMPCVKWQPSIFAKLLPAFPKEGTKKDFKLFGMGNVYNISNLQ